MENKNNNNSKNKNQKLNNEVLGVLLIALSLALIVSFSGKSPGQVTYLVTNLFTGFLGVGAYLIPIIFTVLGSLIVFGKIHSISKYRIISLTIFTVALLILLHSISPVFNQINSFKAAWQYGVEKSWLNRGTGIIGYILTSILIGLFGKVITYIVTLTVIIVSIIITTKLSVKKIMVKAYQLLWDFISHTKKYIYDLYYYQSNKRKLQKEKEQSTKQEKISINYDVKPEQPENINIIDYSKNNIQHPQSVEDKNQKLIPHDESNDENINISPLKENKAIDYYNLPSSLLLDELAIKKNTGDRKTIINNAKILEDTLGNFGIGAKVIQVNKGPAITRYELQPNPGIKVSKIVNLSDDLALSLAAPSVRIEAPIPGKSAIGIEIPNKEVSPVTFREVIETEGFINSSSKLSIVLGKDIAGETVVTDLAKMPHLLIAGATGSGKSVCVNTIISSILYKAAPHEVKLMLIDPKMVELSNYNGIPHLLIPVVTDAKKAASALNWAVQEMTNRYKIFSNEGVKDIFRYNQLKKEIFSDEFMPQIVIIIDELADLMMVSASEVEDSICRLAQMARAAGIHLIVATQRPSVDVITGVIKANIPSRISFAVSSQTDSRTILDCGGAEKLLGRGDMLFHPVGDSKMTRIQCAYISEKEVDRIVEFIKNQTDPQYSTQILDEISKSKTQVSEQSTDELYNEAVRIVVECEQASVSLLQRRLKIGYARAARIIDELEANGVIGGYEGSKPRQVLISKEESAN